MQAILVQLRPGAPPGGQQRAGDVDEIQPRRRFAVGPQPPVGFLLPFQPGGEVGRGFDRQQQDRQFRVAPPQVFD